MVYTKEILRETQKTQWLASAARHPGFQYRLSPHVKVSGPIFPSTIDFSPESFANFLSFEAVQSGNKTRNQGFLLRLKKPTTVMVDGIMQRQVRGQDYWLDRALARIAVTSSPHIPGFPHARATSPLDCEPLRSESTFAKRTSHVYI